MNKAFEKILERLATQKRTVYEYTDSCHYEPKGTEVVDFDDIKEIIQKAAEEYSNTNNICLGFSEGYSKAIDNFITLSQKICKISGVGIDTRNNKEPLYVHEDGTWHSLFDDVAEQLKVDFNVENKHNDELEKLKACQQQHFAICRKYNINSIEDLYNKAIDDFREKLKAGCGNHFVDCTPFYGGIEESILYEEDIDELAEQLKTGEVNKQIENIESDFNMER